METLRRGSTRWLSFTPDRIQAGYALPPGANRATPVALVAPIRPKRGRAPKVSGYYIALLSGMILGASLI